MSEDVVIVDLINPCELTEELTVKSVYIKKPIIKSVKNFRMFKIVNKLNTILYDLQVDQTERALRTQEKVFSKMNTEDLNLFQKQMLEDKGDSLEEKEKELEFHKENVKLSEEISTITEESKEKLKQKALEKSFEVEAQREVTNDDRVNFIANTLSTSEEDLSNIVQDIMSICSVYYEDTSGESVKKVLLKYTTKVVKDEFGDEDTIIENDLLSHLVLSKDEVCNFLSNFIYSTQE